MTKTIKRGDFRTYGYGDKMLMDEQFVSVWETKQGELIVEHYDIPKKGSMMQIVRQTLLTDNEAMAYKKQYKLM